jgi:hypothetical protein
MHNRHINRYHRSGQLRKLASPLYVGSELQDGGAGESRTPDLRFRKPPLYPTELQPRAGHFIRIGRIGEEECLGSGENKAVPDDMDGLWARRDVTFPANSAAA